MTEAELRACSKYVGGGYFVRPDASTERPSPIVHAPEMRDGLLALLAAAERERDAARSGEQAMHDAARAAKHARALLLKAEAERDAALADVARITKHRDRLEESVQWRDGMIAGLAADVAQLAERIRKHLEGAKPYIDGGSGSLTCPECGNVNQPSGDPWWPCNCEPRRLLRSSERCLLCGGGEDTLGRPKDAAPAPRPLTEAEIEECTAAPVKATPPAPTGVHEALAAVCEHGHLRRQCQVCELTEERDQLLAGKQAGEAAILKLLSERDAAVELAAERGADCVALSADCARLLREERQRMKWMAEALRSLLVRLPKWHELEGYDQAARGHLADYDRAARKEPPNG